MKQLFSISLIATAWLIIACNSNKNITTTANTTKSTPPITPAAPVPPKVVNFGIPLPESVYEPMDRELVAIQEKHKEVTLPVLKEGYALYTGVCTNCHEAMGIYKWDVFAWKQIVDSMADKAHLSETQKDAVYKYVLAIKAVEPTLRKN